MARGTKFSEAIISKLPRWRPSSSPNTSALSGSTSANGTLLTFVFSDIALLVQRKNYATTFIILMLCAYCEVHLSLTAAFAFRLNYAELYDTRRYQTQFWDRTALQRHHYRGRPGRFISRRNIAPPRSGSRP